MAVVPYEQTQEEQEMSDAWSDAAGARVLRTVNVWDNNRIFTLKEGTASKEHKFCYFHFDSIEGREVMLNDLEVFWNPEYFQKITA